MAWDAGSIASAAPWAALSTKLKNLCGTSGVGNWEFVENVAAGTGQGQSGSTLYTLDVFRCRGAATRYDPVGPLNKYNSNVTTDGASFAHTISALSASRVFTVAVINTQDKAWTGPGGITSTLIPGGPGTADATNTEPDHTDEDIVYGPPFAAIPTSVTLDGANAPTFSLIKTQSGGNNGEIRISLYMGVSSGSAPTGTTLTVTYGAIQTGCQVILDEWIGLDTTLATTGIDPSGTTQIAVQANGTGGVPTTLTHSTTLGPYSGAKSVAYSIVGEVGSTGTYTAAEGWTFTATAVNSMATPTTRSWAAFRPNGVDRTPTFTNSSATSMTSWAVLGVELLRAAPAATTVTNPNDSGTDWYLAIEIPVPDGAVTSVITAAEEYDGYKMFTKPVSAQAATSPVGTGYWRSTTFANWANVTGTNRAQFVTGVALNTTGFSYWIKLTKDAVCISFRVGATEATYYTGLLDSIITNATDGCPLVSFLSGSSTSSAFTRLPGVTSLTGGTASRGWMAAFNPWTLNVSDGTGSGSAIFNNTANTYVDLWQSGQAYVARIMCTHNYGSTATVAATSGYYRGFVKSEFLAIANGGTVQLGDTLTINGLTYTVIKKMATEGATSQTHAWVTRPS